MVDHGYTIPQDWHQRNGSCGGVNAPHFGTQAGREVTRAIKTAFEKYLADQRAALARAPKITKIQGPKSFARNAPRVALTKVDGVWFTDAVRSYTFAVEQKIKGVQGDIATIDGYLNAWQIVAPVAVEVDRAPTLHMFSNRSRSGVLCVYSHNVGAYRHTTKVENDVTCAACLKTLAAAKADRATADAARALVDDLAAKYGATVRERYSRTAEQAVREIRYKMPTVDKAVRRAACRIIEG
jgi:hypothetical protein